MARRKRRERSYGWVGIVILMTVFLAAGMLLAYAIFGDEHTVILSNDLIVPEIEEKPRATEKTGEETQEREDEAFLVLVNMDNPNLSEERPKELVVMSEVFGDEVTLQVPEGSADITAALAAKHMFLDAKKAGIGKYIITSAYRSQVFQQQQYEEYIAKGASDDYGTVLPGYASEHTTGLAFDILCENYNHADDGYAHTAEGQWLSENAYKYGFILRYPRGKEELTGVAFEPWHYRYVGKNAAKEIYEKGYCLEEYIKENG